MKKTAFDYKEKRKVRLIVLDRKLRDSHRS